MVKTLPFNTGGEVQSLVKELRSHLLWGVAKKKLFLKLLTLQYSCLENPRDGEPGGLPSMGLHRVGHD